MGFSVRKRTKGKDSWLNVSFSKRGLQTSHSMNFGGLTINFGRKTRATVNLGGGARYVTPTSSKKKPSRVKDTVRRYTAVGNTSSAAPYKEDGFSSENIAMMSAMFWCLVSIAVAFLSSSVIAAVVFVNVAHIMTMRINRDKYPQERLSYFIPSILMITPVGWIYLLILFLVV